MTTVAPFGSWASPLSPSRVALAAKRLGAGFADGDDLYWLASDPAAGGRVSLFRRRGAAVAELTPDFNVRSRIHEYGGGAAAAAGGVVVFTDFASQAVYCLEGSGPARPIAGAEGLRFGGFAVDPVRRVAVCVREDHRVAPVLDAVVALDLDGDNAGGGQVVAEGADFYLGPQLSADGRVVWTEWMDPDMPWDATAIKARSLDGGETRTVAAGGRVSRLYPMFAPDGAVLFLSDESGYWNLWRDAGDGPRPLSDFPFDFCHVPWSLTPPPYAPQPDGSVGVAWTRDGWAHVGKLQPDGRLEEISFPGTFADLTPGCPASVLRVGFADRAPGVFALDWETGRLEELAAPPQRLPAGFAVRPRDLSWESPDGPVHAWFYPPANPDYTAPEGELPPVIVLSHGGPTGFAFPGYDAGKLFWTSRGVAVLDVNYSGSDGFGRAYRDRLQGRWGLVDVRDCSQAPLEAARRGWADPARLAIMGGSAGGFTTLACLCFTDVFAAGISLYGVADLEALATDTHKFEAHYLDGIVAPYPAGRAVYLERSPLYHLDGLNCPMLILQGADDMVVPPSQAEAMAAAVKAKGLPVTLAVYPGEGHGFRRAETIVDQYGRSLGFLGEVFGFTPEDAAK